MIVVIQRLGVELSLVILPLSLRGVIHKCGSTLYRALSFGIVYSRMPNFTKLRTYYCEHFKKYHSNQAFLLECRIQIKHRIHAVVMLNSINMRI